MIAHKVEAKFDEKVVNATTNLTLFPNDGYSFEFHANLLVPVTVFYVRISISLPSPNGKFDTMITNSVQDVCKYYKNNGGNMLLRLFFNARVTKKNFPTSCPVAPGLYFMEGFQFDEKYLSIRGTQTKFLVGIDFCQKVDGKLSCFVNVKFFGEIKDRKKWEREMEQKRVGRL